MPGSEVTRVKELAWEQRVSASQLVREILADYRANPRAYDALPDMEGPLSDTLTVYVPAEPWLETRDVAYASGRIPVAMVIRKGLLLRLDAEHITTEA